MFDSPIIEVAVGLTFLFLVFSFCATALLEALSEWRQWRGRLLHTKLETILGTEFVTHFYCERRVADLASGAAPEPDRNARRPSERWARRLGALFELRAPRLSSWVVGRFSRTTLVQAHDLATRMNARRLPASIPEGVFADVMLDWLQGVSLPQALHPDSGNASVLLFDQAELFARMNRRADGDQVVLREELVRWYRQTTDRISGEFRRKVRRALYIVGALLVIGLNLDAVRMAKTLYANPELRTQLVQASDRIVTECPEWPANCAGARANLLQSLDATVNDASSDLIGWQKRELSWAMIAGWIITILAIGMGADFWFGLLKRIVAFRRSVNESAADDALVETVLAQPDSPAPRNAPARDPLDIASPAFAPLKGFQPLRFAESNVHAFWLGHFASLAYGSEAELNASELLQRHGLTAKGYDEGGTQAFLFTGPYVAILAFRGTEKVPEDWITDANIAQVEDPWGVGTKASKVHRGFHDALDRIWPALRADLAKSTAPLWVTGHSLGGALALLAAYRLACDPAKGQPTIGGPPGARRNSRSASSAT